MKMLKMSVNSQYSQAIGTSVCDPDSYLIMGLYKSFCYLYSARNGIGFQCANFVGGAGGIVNKKTCVGCNQGHAAGIWCPPLFAFANGGVAFSFLTWILRQNEGLVLSDQTQGTEFTII